MLAKLGKFGGINCKKTAQVLISFGAVLGRLHPMQLLVMAMCEVVVFAVNIHIGFKYFKAIDAGSGKYASFVMFVTKS